jgi:hypothetical protein
LPQPEKPYRVSTEVHDGFSLPNQYREGNPYIAFLGKENPILLSEEEKNSAICLFNDTGMSNFSRDASWIGSEQWAKRPWKDLTWAVIKQSSVSDTSLEFIEALRRPLSERVITYIAADDLRREGFEISKSLSWESSVQDVIDVACGDGKQSNKFRRLGRRIVITFDYDSALFLDVDPFTKEKINKGILVYSTSRSEGEFRSRFKGSMPGSRSTFCSVFVGMLHNFLKENDFDSPSDECIEKLLTYPLVAIQKYLGVGFHPLSNDTMFSGFPESGFDEDGRRFLNAIIFNHESIFALPSKRVGLKGDQTALPPSPISPYENPSDEFDNP